ncbi:uncharacterized protein BDW70DRAFT_127448 [Aspergillus foveolatus]|uniref:uncharacterized protein n=1 Tax=Aspergillus foveolatus TaxID=210207 RepID=UPI003CCD63E5
MQRPPIGGHEFGVTHVHVYFVIGVRNGLILCFFVVSWAVVLSHVFQSFIVVLLDNDPMFLYHVLRS